MISVTMLSKNSERTIGKALESLRWADEVILLDTGSTDHTLEIAATFHNVKIHKTPFTGFGELHNLATELAAHPWILSVDSDEVVSPELAEELSTLVLDAQTVYSVARHNYFNDRWIRGCGWYPDRCLRLYNRTATRFSSQEVHESILMEGMELVELKGPLLHFSYPNIASLLEKMQLYSDLFARQYRHKRRSSLPKALTHAFTTFFISYLLQRGLFFGYEGFVISLYKAHTAYYKYLKLREANRSS